MSANHDSLKRPQVMSEHLERAEPGLLRCLLKMFVQALMSAEADGVCVAPHGFCSPERVGARSRVKIGMRWPSTDMGRFQTGLEAVRGLPAKTRHA